jgi:hypothetical protein
MGEALSDTISVSRLTVIQPLFSHYVRGFILVSSLTYLALDSEVHNSLAVRRTEKYNSEKEANSADSKDKNPPEGVVCKRLFSCRM